MPYAILYPQYSAMRSLSRLLSVQALQEARDGNGAAALQDIRAVYRMSDHVTSDTIYISFLISRAISVTANKALAQILEIQPPEAAQARAFEASLPHADWDEVVRRAHLIDRAMGIYGFEIFSSVPLSAYDSENQPELPQWAAKPIAILWSPFSKLDEVYFLRLWQNHLDTLQPLQIPLKPRHSTADLQDQLPSYAFITRTLFPDYLDTRKRRATIEVARRQRQNALAIAAYRDAHNVYPATLQQAAAAWDAPLLTDPYTAKPFGYRSNGQTFTLYSFGPNAADDKGFNTERNGLSVSQKNHVAPNADDIVWDYNPDIIF